MRLGLDIGGTKIEAVILDEHGEAIYRQRYATPKQHYEEFLQAVITAVHDAQANARQPLTVGLGIPGAAGRDGLIKNSNILVLNHQPFVQQLEQHFAMPIAVTNDCSAAIFFAQKRDKFCTVGRCQKDTFCTVQK